jgi:hypothetical protein
MSDHEFEKQVRQTLDDLRLTPSPSAWQKIESAIRDTRRRRAPLLWLPLLVIGLGAGGYFLLKDSNPPASKTATITQDQEPSASQIDPPSSQRDPSASQTDPSASQTDPSPSQTVPLTSQTTVPNPAGSTSTEAIPSASKPAFRSKDQLAITRHKKVSGEESGSESPRITLPQVEPIIKETVNVIPEEVARTEEITSGQRPFIKSSDKRVSDKDLKHYFTVLAPDFPALIKPLNFPHSQIPAANAFSDAVPPVLIQPKKWSFGISAFAGISGLNDGNLFNLNKAFASDMSTPANVAFAPSYTPYKIVPASSYSVGIVVGRELNKRFQIISGLNYVQTNVRYKPGNQAYGRQALNAAPPLTQYVLNYFTLDQHKPDAYKNTYHFVELPVALQTRLTKSRWLPVFWNTGVSYSRLFSSNSKQFDGSTGIYYSNTKWLNKGQFAVSTGFDFVLRPRSKYPLWLGPSAKYNLTPLTSETFAEKKNLLSAGINLKLFIR